MLVFVAWLASAACWHGSPALAGEPAKPGPLPSPPPSAFPPDAGKPDPAGMVTLNFNGVDLVEVVHVLARHLRLNYTIDPGVGGAVNLFSGQPVRRDDLLPILHEILRIHGAVAVKEKTHYRITPVSNASALVRPHGPEDGGPVMQVLPVRHFPVAAMRRLLEPFMSDGGLMLDHVRGNYLIVVDLASRIRRLAEIGALLDAEAFAGTRMELYRPRAASARDLARELSAAMRFSAGPARSAEPFGARFLPLPRINRLLVIAYSEAAWRRVKPWIERLDVADEVAARKIFIRAVQNRKATELARVLNLLYGSGRGSAPGPSPPSRPDGLGAGPGPWPGEDSAGREPGRPLAGEKPVTSGGLPRTEQTRPTERRPPSGPARGATPSFEGTGQGVRVVAEPDTNSLVILATPRRHAEILEVLDRLDRVSRQVLMEVLVAEVTLTDDFEFGLEYAVASGGFGVPAAAATEEPVAVPGVQGLGSGFSSIVRAGRDFRVFVKALMQDARVKVLSSPQLLAADNRPARIRVGSEQPVATGTVVSQEARATTTTIQFRNVGRILTIIPQVSSRGLVNLQVRVEVSDVGKRVLVGGQSFDAFNVRDAETTAVLEDGQTLVIGGIITDNRRKSRIGIPLLMDVPLVGALFRADLERSERTELVILITPRVIRDRREGETATERFLNRVGALRRELEAGRLRSRPAGPEG